VPAGAFPLCLVLIWVFREFSLVYDFPHPQSNFAVSVLALELRFVFWRVTLLVA